MFGQAVEYVSGAGARSQSSTPHRGGALLQMYSRQLRSSHDPPSLTTCIRAHSRPRRGATVPPHRGHRTRRTTTGIPIPAQVAAPLRGRQDLRHSYTSLALALGEGLPIIGRLLGHRRTETTARYAHLARDSVGEAAKQIAVSIAADMLWPPRSLGSLSGLRSCTGRSFGTVTVPRIRIPGSRSDRRRRLQSGRKTRGYSGHTFSAIDLNCETPIEPRSLRDFEPGAVSRAITASRPASQISRTS